MAVICAFICRFGYNKWRDSRQPTQILSALCEEHGLDPPAYELQEHRVIVDGHEFYGPNDFQDESGKLRSSPEPLALEALKSWHSMPGFGSLSLSFTSIYYEYSSDLQVY